MFITKLRHFTKFKSYLKYFVSIKVVVSLIVIQLRSKTNYKKKNKA